MIKVNNLHFMYPSRSQWTLQNINFQIQRGEIFGFLGPSGAGKSTTQKILIRLLKYFEGEITVFGKDLREWDSELYEHTGVSFEVPNHFLKLTGLENLQYFKSLYQNETEDLHQLLEWVNLQNDGHTLVSQYSKGMKVRLNFARALINNPELIFLDEPTMGLDPVNARRLKDLIVDKKQKGKTVFLTTHNMNVADELCDQLLFWWMGKSA